MLNFFSVLPYGRSLADKLSILAGLRSFSSSLHTVFSQSDGQTYLCAFNLVPSTSHFYRMLNVAVKIVAVNPSIVSIDIASRVNIQEMALPRSSWEFYWYRVLVKFWILCRRCCPKLSWFSIRMCTMLCLMVVHCTDLVMNLHNGFSNLL
jgi:hypothetical protein